MKNKTLKNDTVSIADIMKRMKHLSECNSALIEELRSNQMLISYYQRKIDYYTKNPTSFCANTPDNHFINNINPSNYDRES